MGKKLLIIILAGLVLVLLAIKVSFKSREPLPVKKITPVAKETPVADESRNEQPKEETSKLWGAYTDWRASDIKEFEEKVGRKMNYLATFVHWGNDSEFPAELAKVAKEGNKTLVIFWEAMDYNFSSPEDPRFSYSQILSGAFDKYFSVFAQSAKEYGDPLIIIPFEEMNGDWYSWSISKNGNNASKHVQSYRYLRGFFKEVPNVEFGWVINSESAPDVTGINISEIYPGNDYVDYVGVNGFNFGLPWQTFEEIFSRTLERLVDFHKPTMIFSMACAEGKKKAGWIEDALGKQIPKYSYLVGWIWFNENKERDWRVWSDPESLKSFQRNLPN